MKARTHERDLLSTIGSMDERGPHPADGGRSADTVPVREPCDDRRFGAAHRSIVMKCPLR
ncbi:Hypothetical protein A7982_02099 [Minicystis rosea]|nr:Hypothetical protein A7982_02099 [Minicystis rosea]